MYEAAVPCWRLSISICCPVADCRAVVVSADKIRRRTLYLGSGSGGGKGVGSYSVLTAPHGSMMLDSAVSTLLLLLLLCSCCCGSAYLSRTGSSGMLVVSADSSSQVHVSQCRSLGRSLLRFLSSHRCRSLSSVQTRLRSHRQSLIRAVVRAKKIAQLWKFYYQYDCWKSNAAAPTGGEEHRSAEV